MTPIWIRVPRQICAYASSPVLSPSLSLSLRRGPFRDRLFVPREAAPRELWPRDLARVQDESLVLKDAPRGMLARMRFENCVGRRRSEATRRKPTIPRFSI
jgi:hypothetical protein